MKGKEKERYLSNLNIIYQKQNGWCAIAESKNKVAEITELHHTHIHNTKPNRKRYPLLLNSLWNLYGVNHHYHMAFPSWSPPAGRWSLMECDRRERFLERHPIIAEKLHAD